MRMPPSVELNRDLGWITVSACIVIECVPISSASLGIVNEEEKLTGGFGPADRAMDCRLLPEDMTSL
jgi:hypothetical protein